MNTLLTIFALLTICLLIAINSKLEDIRGSILNISIKFYKRDQKAKDDLDY